MENLSYDEGSENDEEEKKFDFSKVSEFARGKMSEDDFDELLVDLVDKKEITLKKYREMKR